MPYRTTSKLNIKVKTSYTLSAESVAFLQAMRKSRRAASLSAVLEEILSAARTAHERRSVERAVANYYSGLSATEAKDLAEWGDFALREFPAEDLA